MITSQELKAAMTYRRSVTPETVTVGGYKIEFWQDQDAANPYDDDEGMTPALWLSAGHYRKIIREYGAENLGGFFEKMPLRWISRNWRAICKILDIADSDHDKEARRYAVDYNQNLAESRKDLFANHLSDKNGGSWSYALDYMESLRALYNLAGIYAETYQRNGYCQGDSVYGLIVATPAWISKTGVNPDHLKKDMSLQADTYGSWTWGDCYGFTVSTVGDSWHGGNDFDSCGGFIGDSLEDSGLWDMLQNAIACYEANLKKET